MRPALHGRLEAKRRGAGRPTLVTRPLQPTRGTPRLPEREIDRPRIRRRRAGLDLVQLAHARRAKQRHATGAHGHAQRARPGSRDADGGRRVCCASTKVGLPCRGDPHDLKPPAAAASATYELSLEFESAGPRMGAPHCPKRHSARREGITADAPCRSTTRWPRRRVTPRAPLRAGPFAAPDRAATTGRERSAANGTGPSRHGGIHVHGHDHRAGRH